MVDIDKAVVHSRGPQRTLADVNLRFSCWWNHTTDIELQEFVPAALKGLMMLVTVSGGFSILQLGYTKPL